MTTTLRVGFAMIGVARPKRTWRESPWLGVGEQSVRRFRYDAFLPGGGLDCKQ